MLMQPTLCSKHIPFDAHARNLCSSLSLNRVWMLCSRRNDNCFVVRFFSQLFHAWDHSLVFCRSLISILSLELLEHLINITSATLVYPFIHPHYIIYLFSKYFFPYIYFFFRYRFESLHICVSIRIILFRHLSRFWNCLAMGIAFVACYGTLLLWKVMFWERMQRKSNESHWRQRQWAFLNFVYNPHGGRFVMKRKRNNLTTISKQMFYRLICVQRVFLSLFVCVSFNWCALLSKLSNCISTFLFSLSLSCTNIFSTKADYFYHLIFITLTSISMHCTTCNAILHTNSI